MREAGKVRKLKKGDTVTLLVYGAGVVSEEKGHKVRKVGKKGIELSAFDSPDYVFDPKTLSTKPLDFGFRFQIKQEAAPAESFGNYIDDSHKKGKDL